MVVPVSKFVSTIRNIGGGSGYLRQNKVNSYLEPFLLGKLIQAIVYFIFGIFHPVVSRLVLVIIVLCLSCYKLEG